MIPSIGRIVHIRLSDQCAKNINKKRNNVNMDVPHDSDINFHVGNAVFEGDIFPMIITKIWSESPDENTTVNGQVFLDGSDTYWVTSVKQGTELGQWFSPVGE